MNRKAFIRTAGVGAALTLAGDNLMAQKSTAKDDIPPLPISLVKEFVIAGHANFDKVKSMLLETPNLIYSQFDWGNGDFEAAIEGAGHLGNKVIANYLLEAGSRTTIFVMTMLGKTDLVKSILEKYPRFMTTKGPHGFTLLHHAKVGGKDSEELYTYLQEKGIKDDWVKLK
ncbi:hypothetical protein [Mucilaginibacter sp.]|uniref:hypothetical protein n=1 Tax=Mucilaginibacter sp. TaxID=1882438 RepID=UPI0025DC5D43|nr:hypothetical protein [Mucilaginibacter sp.]